MLKKLKEIYLLIPLPVSKFLIKIFNLNPYFSKKTWKKIDIISKEYNDLNILNKNMEKLLKSLKIL